MNYLKLFFIFFIYSCTVEDTPPIISTESTPISTKNNRLLGIDLLNLTESNSFSDNITLANELGIEFIALHRTWTQLEPTANNFNDPDQALELLSQTAVANGFKFSLTIRPIDLIGKTVPTDLQNVRFNDTLLINRFKRCLDYVFTKVDVANLLNLQIGNEVDGFDTSLEPLSFWADYEVFLEQINQHVKSQYPYLKVGFTGTLFGLNSNPVLFNSLLTKVDVLGVTYYPINSNFSVQEPSQLSVDLQQLLDNYPSKPIYMQELGYQSGVLSNSSETKQAAFYNQFFEFWDVHHTEIKTVNLVRLNDLSLQEAQNSAIPYGISDPIFIDYLRTLGIRTYSGNGTDKASFTTIKQAAKARGW